MAILTPDQLKAQIDDLIPNNSAGLVTEPILRAILTNMVDSLGGTASTPDPDPETTHVFALLGQSNMVGRATFDGGATHPAGVQQWGRTGGNDGALIAATIPLDHHDPSPGDMGLDITFATDWLSTYGGALVLMPGADGGTSLSSGFWQKGGDGFEDAVARINALMAANPSFTFSGFLWHQGESDEGNAAYQAQLDQMIADFRTDVIAADAATPFVLGEMAPDFVTGTPAREAIQAIIADTPNRVDFTAVVQTSDLTTFDNLHFDAASLRTLGIRYVNAHAIAATDNAIAPPVATGTIPDQSDTF